MFLFSWAEWAERIGESSELSRGHKLSYWNRAVIPFDNKGG